jgi:hypothetical protein
MTVPLSAWATSIIVTLRVEVISGQQSHGRLRVNPEAGRRHPARTARKDN